MIIIMIMIITTDEHLQWKVHKKASFGRIKKSLVGVRWRVGWVDGCWNCFKDCLQQSKKKNANAKWKGQIWISIRDMSLKKKISSPRTWFFCSEKVFFHIWKRTFCLNSIKRFSQLLKYFFGPIFIPAHVLYSTHRHFWLL